MKVISYNSNSPFSLLILFRPCELGVLFLNKVARERKSYKSRRAEKLLWEDLLEVKNEPQ